MNAGAFASAIGDTVGRFGRRFVRRGDLRRILVDARTAVNFTMVAPIVRGLAPDPRVRFYFTASEEPWRMRQIYREATDVRLIDPARAALMRFDAYLASDFTWQWLARGTCRIQMFHGVAGKYGFDAPQGSMRAWHRLFFINERRLRSFKACGAIDPDSPAVRLVGMPKTDALVNGAWSRGRVLESLSLDPARPTVLYAPTWSPASSLNTLGIDLIQRLLDSGLNVIVKLHDRSRDRRPRYSGGVDWVARIEPLLSGRPGALATGHDISPYLAAADVMVTDHSSAGFEFLLRDRPLVRIHRPELIALANIHREYVELLASASQSVHSVDECVRAVERGLEMPEQLGASRRAVARELFYGAGTATLRAVQNLYEAIGLDPAAHVVRALEHPTLFQPAVPTLPSTTAVIPPHEAECRP
jgi:CDP-Glycerol:Poly(glycerophosphate) glycerophosphotransferase